MSLATVKVTPTGFAVLIVSVFLIFVFYWRGNFRLEESDQVSLKNLLVLAVKLSQEGGLQVAKVHETAQLNLKSKGKTKEGANDPRTDADLFSHRVITQGFKNDYPHLAVISEEHDDKVEIENNNGANLNEISNEIKDLPESLVPLRDVTVWVDPLDATQEFTEDLLQFVTTMICIAVKGKPVIGVIHEPFTKNTVWGWDEIATSPNLHHVVRPLDQKPKIIVSRSHAGMVRDAVIAAFGNDTEIVPAGGAGYKTLQLMNGNVDAYVHVTNIKKWDLCAANALLGCLGGKMTTLNGDIIDYSPDSGVESHGGLLGTLYNHNKYLKLLKAFSTVFE